MHHFKGKPTNEMTRDELIAALAEMCRLYQAAIDEQVMLFDELCRRAKPARPWWLWVWKC